MTRKGRYNSKRKYQFMESKSVYGNLGTQDDVFWDHGVKDAQAANILLVKGGKQIEEVVNMH